MDKQSELLENVGDSAFDPASDDPEFSVCDTTRVRQYYEFGGGMMYQDDKKAIEAIFREKFQTRNSYASVSGYVVIRFIVNCAGKTGRFRVTEFDTAYQATHFEEELTGSILEITRSLNGWGVPSNSTQKFDYYQYLTFKIERGAITEIMP